MDHKYEIVEISNDSDAIIQAMDLVWKVFTEFEAPDYTDEGIQEFKNFISIDSVEQRIHNKELFLWACLDAGKIIGIIASRPPCHIALLFVDKFYHRRGIAKALYHVVLDYYRRNGDRCEITVNSSPYAVEAYHRLGFVDIDFEQTINGIRFTPMKHVFE